MDGTIAAIGLALSAAAVWGAGDFSGALASRRSNVSGVLVVSHGMGMLVLTLIVFLRGETITSERDVLLGGAAGFLIGLGLAALYRAFAVGRMSLVAPIAAVLSAIIPIVFGIFTQGLPTPIQLGGFGIALVGITFISRSTAGDQGHGGIQWAVVAGISVGFYFIVMQQVNTESLFVPLALVRVTSFTMMIAFALWGRRNLSMLPTGTTLLFAMLAGLMDVLGSGLYVLAGDYGRLDVVAVLSSLYPASTVVLARLFLKEHSTRQQNLSILAILLAIVLVTAG